MMGCRGASRGARTGWRIRAVLLACALILGLHVSAAGASRTQESIIQSDGLLLNLGPEKREATLDTFDVLGVDTVKFFIPWRDLAPDPKLAAKPLAFDASNPAAYPVNAWDRFDALLLALRRHGLRPLVGVAGGAPDWATSGRASRPEPGARNPRPDEFAKFVQAVGRRYDGSWVSPRGEVLPRVDYWSVWNEPNHPLFLQPQSAFARLPVNGEMRRVLIPSSPHRYRALYRAARRGLQRSGHGRERVLLGEILPVGARSLGYTNNLSPVTFLKEFFCLDARNRPFLGEAARVRGCDGFRSIRTAGLAYHPYTRRSPHWTTPRRTEAPIGQVRRIIRVLDTAARRGRVRERTPVYSTEFGIFTGRGAKGVSLARQAEYLNVAEYLHYREPRIRSYSQYLLQDSPAWVSGLVTEGGDYKPAAFAYRLGLVVLPHGRRTVRIWGVARAATAGERVAIQALVGKRWRFVANARTNSRGYLDRTVNIPRGVVGWRLVHKGLVSRVAQRETRIVGER